MEINPALRATRCSQLKPGELFIFLNGSASAVPLAAADPTRDGDMVINPLGMTDRATNVWPPDSSRIPDRQSGATARPPSPEDVCVGGFFDLDRG